MLETRFRHRGMTYVGKVEKRTNEDGEEGETVVSGSDSFDVSEVALLPPCEPTKVVAVGRNYAEHAEEFGNEVPEFPLLFFKPPSSVTGSGSHIKYPDFTQQLDYEGELGVVIDSKCKSVSEDEALDYVRGYTCVNDVTARDWQDKEKQWARAKGSDGFCPIGPYVQTDVERLKDSLEIETRVNGEIKQSSETKHMVFSIPELVSEVSRFMTLKDGDVIATGTPEGVGSLETGDEVEVEIEGVGVLKNNVV